MNRIGTNLSFVALAKEEVARAKRSRATPLSRLILSSCHDKVETGEERDRTLASASARITELWRTGIKELK